MDAGLIAAIVCFCLGGLLLIVGFILLTWAYCRVRREDKQNKRRARENEHARHLAIYSARAKESESIRIGGHTNNGFIPSSPTPIPRPTDQDIFFVPYEQTNVLY